MCPPSHFPEFHPSPWVYVVHNLWGSSFVFCLDPLPRIFCELVLSTLASPVGLGPVTAFGNYGYLCTAYGSWPKGLQTLDGCLTIDL